MTDDKFKKAYQYGMTKQQKFISNQSNIAEDSLLNRMQGLLNDILAQGDLFSENETAKFIIHIYRDKNNQQRLMKRTLTLKNEIIDKEEFNKIINNSDEED